MSYLTAINDHDFGQYARLLIRRERQRLTAAGFASGYLSTSDSNATLVGISATGQDVAATVTFTSKQNPVPGMGITGCTNWDITLYLRQHGSGFRIDTPPPGYHAYDHSCG